MKRLQIQRFMIKICLRILSPRVIKPLSLWLTRSLSPDYAPLTSQCTYTHQYARSPTEGFRHISRAAQISVSIQTGKGLWVQLQVTLGVTHEVREIGSSPWKWRYHWHGNDERDYVMFYWVKEERRKRGSLQVGDWRQWLCYWRMCAMSASMHARSVKERSFPTTHIQHTCSKHSQYKLHIYIY